MLKAKLEVTDREKISDFLKNNRVVRLAFNTDSAPYIVPMNYGFEYNDGELVLFLHCATQGRKIELIKKDPYIGFEIDATINTVTADVACRFSIKYESIIGTGHICITDDAEKVNCLNKIMLQFSGKEKWDYDEKFLKRTSTLKLIVDDFTMKKN